VFCQKSVNWGLLFAFCWGEIMSGHRLSPFRMNGPLNIGARLCQRDEKLWQHEEAYALSRKLPKMVCNYNFYHGGRTRPRKVVQQHLNTYSHDPTRHNAKFAPIKFPSLFHQNKVMLVVF
jgi:hypothetical protein